MSNYEINKIYEFEIEDFSFGGLSKEVLINAFKDGRITSHLLERQINVWFPNIDMRKINRWNEQSSHTQTYYDLKCFTKSGLTFSPSSMNGIGRDLDESAAKLKSLNIVYVCCDIFDFPKIKVKFCKGSQLSNSYPKFKIPFKDKETFFS